VLIEVVRFWRFGKIPGADCHRWGCTKHRYHLSGWLYFVGSHRLMRALNFNKNYKWLRTVVKEEDQRMVEKYYS
jgi:hypothetical protein